MSKTDTLLLVALTWAVAAYIVVPKLWAMYFRRHPDFADLDRCTKTGDGHPGDPINMTGIAGRGCWVSPRPDGASGKSRHDSPQGEV